MTAAPAQDIAPPRAGTSDGIIDSPPTAPGAPNNAPVETREADPLPREKCGALLLGGSHGALGVLRSLGRHGIPAWFISDNHPLARFSRYARTSLNWSGPNDAGAVDWLLELGRRHRLDGWVLVPCADEEARLISQHRAALSLMYRLITPDWDVLQWAYDKRRMNERAAALGIDVPRSLFPAGRGELAHAEVPFPAIIKPTVKHGPNALTRAKAWRVDDRDALLARYDEAVALVGPEAVVVQELIPGRGDAQFSYAGVWDRGRPLASLTARRARQYPIEFGYTSTLVETIDQPEVEALACRFLESIGYDGMAEAEFKYDARERRFKLLDVNARTWTWIALGRRAGVDFPHLAWRHAFGESLPPLRGRAGVSWMHASRDAVAALEEMAAGHLSLKNYWASLRRPIEFAAFAADDPLPALIDLPLSLTRFLMRTSPTER